MFELLRLPRDSNEQFDLELIKRTGLDLKAFKGKARQGALTEGAGFAWSYGNYEVHYYGFDDSYVLFELPQRKESK